jgi:enoyl-CoA hydratase
MDHEGLAQLYVRLTTQNFEEAVRARKEKRPPVFRD